MAQSERGLKPTQLSGNASDKRIFTTSFTGGREYPISARVLSSAVSTTSGHSANGRFETRELKMTNTNTANSANKSQFINLNQPIQQVLFEFYKWYMHQVQSDATKNIFPTEDSIQNWYCLESHLRNVLIDFKPQNSIDERIKLSVLVDEIESQALDHKYVLHMNEITGNDLVAHRIARQLLQR